LAGWLLHCDVHARPVSGGIFVRKRLESFSSIATVAAFFAMISFGTLLQAQQTTPGAQSAPQTQPAPPQQPPDTQAPLSTPESGQQTPSQTQPAAPPPDQSQAAPEDATGSKEMVGTIVKQGDKYMFQDTATGTTYDIDHQDEVKKFEGKKVRVHGTIDPNTKTIHVQ
jgi:uncharacterized protein YdeI (BOF family)